jgi:hypothetical protein
MKQGNEQQKMKNEHQPTSVKINSGFSKFFARRGVSFVTTPLGVLKFILYGLSLDSFNYYF